VQDLISDLQGQEPGVAAFMIHNFVRNTIIYSQAQAQGPDPVGYNYRGVFGDWQNGDCDNHATMTTALLRYAGIDPEDITYVLADYQVSAGGVSTPPVGHAFVVVDIDGQKLVLDMNFENPMILNPDYTARGVAAGDEGSSFAGHELNLTYSNFMMVVPVDRGADMYIGPHILQLTQAPQELNRTSTPTEAAPPAPLPRIS
jgi:hypothetical protein